MPQAATYSLTQMRQFGTDMLGTADEITAKLKELDNEMTPAVSGWTGDSGSAFKTAWESWYKGAEGMRDIIECLGNVVRQSADKVESDEQLDARGFEGIDHG